MASSTAFGGNPLAIARKEDRCDAFGVFGDKFWRLIFFGIGKRQSMFLGERLRNLRGILWVSTRCMFWLLAVSRTQASYSPDVYPDMFGR